MFFRKTSEPLRSLIRLNDRKNERSRLTSIPEPLSSAARLFFGALNFVQTRHDIINGSEARQDRLSGRPASFDFMDDANALGVGPPED